MGATVLPTGYDMAADGRAELIDSRPLDAMDCEGDLPNPASSQWLTCHVHGCFPMGTQCKFDQLKIVFMWAQQADPAVQGKGKISARQRDLAVGAADFRNR